MIAEGVVDGRNGSVLEVSYGVVELLGSDLELEVGKAEYEVEPDGAIEQPTVTVTVAV